MADADGGFLEFKQRVVYSLLRAAARIALRFKLPLGQLETLTQMAYFEEARHQQGLRLDEIAELFGKSLRTVSSLHNRFRGDFFAPEREVTFRRAIAALVNHAPLDAARLRAAFPDAADVEMAAALDDLVRERKITRVGDAWRRHPDAHEFTGQDVAARIDGLNRQMDILAATVWRRLVEPSPRPALARTLVFHASDPDFAALIAEIEAVARERAIAADTAYEQTHAGGQVGLTFAAAPLEEDR